MELLEIKGILLGRTLSVRNIGERKAVDYIITDIETSIGGYTIYCSEGIAGYFLTNELIKALCEKAICSDEWCEYIIKQTEIGGRAKKVIDWEERTWQIAYNLYAFGRFPRLDSIKMAHRFVEQYKEYMKNNITTD